MRQISAYVGVRPIFRAHLFNRAITCFRVMSFAPIPFARRLCAHFGQKIKKPPVWVAQIRDFVNTGTLLPVFNKGQKEGTLEKPSSNSNRSS
jgi:hypothetical protein